MDEAELSSCSPDYGIRCSWWGSAPIHVYNHTHTERGGREKEREQGGDTPFPLDKNPLTPTYPWLLSSMGKGKIGILSGSGLFIISSSDLDALIFTPGLVSCYATCWSWGRWCINTSPSIAGIDYDSVGIYLERRSNENNVKSTLHCKWPQCQYQIFASCLTGTAPAKLITEMRKKAKRLTP